MTTLRALSIGILFAMGVLGLPAQTQPYLPYGGSYEITARLELPHLERWAVDKVTIVCLTGSRSGDELPIPVVSANNPFAKMHHGESHDGRFEARIRHCLPWARSRQGPRQLHTLTQQVFWSRGDGNGREEHDDDGSATSSPDRMVQSGGARVSSIIQNDTGGSSPTIRCQR